MPQTLDRFVKGPRQSNNAAVSTPVDLAQRAQIAEKVKIKQREVRKPPTLLQAAPDNRTAHTIIQQSRAHIENDGGLFAESELGDSDSTTRDLGVLDLHGHQSLETSQDAQNFQDGDGVGYAKRQGYASGYEVDDEENDAVSNLKNIEDEPDEEDDQFQGFQIPISTGPMREQTFESVQQHARQLKKSPNYAMAQNIYNHGRSLNTVLDIHPGVSGRFTPATNLVDDVVQITTKPDGIKLVHHESRPQRGDVVYSDDVASSDSDEHVLQNYLQPGGLEHGNQFYHALRNGRVQDQISDARHNAEDRSNESELESHFEGSGQSSPSERTPRGSGMLNKPTTTPSQRRKRNENAVELDYDTNALSTMKYSELKDELFDSNPRPIQSILPDDLRGPETSLEEKLEYFKGQGPDQQAAMFAQMPINQWEQSGDWFLDRFSDIISKLKDARRAKRDVSKAFEEKLANREKAVREKSEGIQDVLRQMRAGGEGVLKGRAS